MIRKIFKILPYCVIVWTCKKFGADWGTFNKDKVRYMRIDKGEFVVWNEPNYDRMKEAQDKRKQTNLDRKARKLEKKLNNDFELKERIKEEFKDEERQEDEEREYNMNS